MWQLDVCGRVRSVGHNRLIERNWRGSAAGLARVDFLALIYRRGLNSIGRLTRVPDGDRDFLTMGHCGSHIGKADRKLNYKK
jgi:hypothetical protein